jgi:hypothetical protein
MAFALRTSVAETNTNRKRCHFIALSRGGLRSRDKFWSK